MSGRRSTNLANLVRVAIARALPAGQSGYRERAPKRARWVCACCGRHTAAGARRDALGDSACVSWAVKCHAERDVSGQWVAYP